MIQIINHEIDSQAVLASVASPDCGANILFLGTTRRMTDGRETEKLDYECYLPMAERTMGELRDQALQKWKIEKVSLVHRIGAVEIGQASIAVAVSGPHRADTFEAASWIIDTLKKQVPIWKKESWADGSTEWVHPEEG